MKELEQYIESINTASSPEEAFARFCTIMRKHGYERVAYSLVTDHPTLGLPRQHGLVTSYPEDWMKYYSEKNYMDIDPVTARIREMRKPFFWSEVTESPNIEKPAITLMNEAGDAGVKDGIGISLCSTAGEVVGVGLARNDFSEKRDYQFLASAFLLSVYFHETYRSMLSKPPRIEISGREKEILCWAAEGKTDSDISSILNISLNTVRFHWKNIFRKLDVYGRVYAITKAIRLQLISPNIIRSTYQKR
jgi:DNA-binding CsgD family transcriptional regulator